MMTNKSLTALMRHLNGITAILKTSGVQSLQSESSRRTFYEYRSIYLPIALSIRKANFLSSPEWINPPWKRSEPLSASKLHTVSDIGFEIPGLMERFDQLQQHEHDNSTQWMLSQLNNLILEGLTLQQAFADWGDRVLGEQEKGLFYIPRQARPMGNYHSPYPISFTFKNWDIAGGLSYHDMLQIFLYTLLIDIETFAQHSKINPPALSGINSLDLTQRSIECADQICQSTEWFLEDHKKLIGRMMILAPFEAAKGLFLRLARDVTGDAEQDEMLKMKNRFCEMITRRIVDSGSPVWGG
jgi:hypothetical protein